MLCNVGLVLALASLSWCASPASPSSSPDSPTISAAEPEAALNHARVAETLIETERQAWLAWKERRLETLSQVDAGFAYSADGRDARREQYLRSVASTFIRSYELSQFHVSFTSDNTATLTFYAAWERIEGSRGKIKPQSARMKTEWRRAADAWVCTAAVVTGSK
jgi:hypothetical protein